MPPTPITVPTPHGATYQWETMMGPVRVDLAPESLTVHAPGVRAERPWALVTAAGLLQPAQQISGAQVPADLWKELGAYLPGLGRLIVINDRLATDYRQIVIACGPRYGELVRIPYPIGNPHAEAARAALQARLGALWVGELPAGSYHRTLGVRYPWWGVPLTIGFVFVLAWGLAFTCLGLYALTEGDLSLFGYWYVWVGFAIWFGIFGAILWLYRHDRN